MDWNFTSGFLKLIFYLNIFLQQSKQNQAVITAQPYSDYIPVSWLFFPWFYRKEAKELDEIWGAFSLLQGNILEDEWAISILSSSKKLSQEIHKEQEITKIEKQIDETRDGCRPANSFSHFHSYCLNWIV